MPWSGSFNMGGERELINPELGVGDPLASWRLANMGAER